MISDTGGPATARMVSWTPRPNTKLAVYLNTDHWREMSSRRSNEISKI